MTSGPVDCEFCAIVRGEDRSAQVVGEEEAWVAFFPLKPATPGHTLVVPREHVADLWGVGWELGANLMHGVVRVGGAIRTALEPEGTNVITSSGMVAEQTVFHLHFHIVPRWKQDGFGRIWPAEKTFTRSDLGDVATLIRRALSTEQGA